MLILPICEHGISSHLFVSSSTSLNNVLWFGGLSPSCLNLFLFVVIVNEICFLFFSVLFLYLFFTSQYCIGFAIHWHESAIGVHVFPILNPFPPPSPSDPSGSSQCTSPKHPVSCIKPGLVICFTYDNIHVKMPFSRSIPPLPSPIESKRLFYTSVSLLLSHIQDYHYHLSKLHIYVLVYSIGVFLLAYLLCIIGSSFIHLIRTDSNVFFLMAK